VYPCTCMYVYMYIYIYMRSPTHTHVRVRTHTHTHTLSLSLSLSLSHTPLSFSLSHTLTRTHPGLDYNIGRKDRERCCLFSEILGFFSRDFRKKSDETSHICFVRRSTCLQTQETYSKKKIYYPIQYWWERL